MHIPVIIRYMIIEYINTAMKQARYKIIEDSEPYYGEIPSLKGVWATGKTLERCRESLEETLEGWLVVRLQRGLSIPSLNGKVIGKLQKVKV